MGGEGPVRRALPPLALAAAGAVGGAAGGAALAGWLASGVAVDWYRAPPLDPVPSQVALAAAYALAVALAATLAPAAVLLAGRRPLPQAPRTVGGHALLAACAAGGLLAAGALGAVWVAFGSGPAPANLLGAVLASLGLAGGAAVPLLAWRSASRAIARGVVGRGGDPLLTRVMLASARRPRTTLLAVLAVTLVMAGGLDRITTNVDVADVLPRGDPNTDAAHNLTARFKTAFTQQTTLMFHVNEAVWERDNARLPDRVTEPRPGNITDEVYLRALEQAIVFMSAQEPFAGHVGLVGIYSLINWTLEGGDDAPPSSYALPPTDPAGSARFAVLEEGVWAAGSVASAADAVISPSFRQTAAFLQVAPGEDLPSRAIGEGALRARDAYVAWATANPGVAYQVFTGPNAPVFSVEVPVANAHASALARADAAALAPVIAAWIAVVLFLAFRNAAAVLAAFGALAASTVLTYGAMGYLGIPLNTLNLTVVPLIVGVSVDYSIHVINDFQAQRAAGAAREDAVRRVARTAALALFIANLNTIAGLLVMVASPSLLIAQLGLLASIAILASYVLMITYMPAALSLQRRDAAARSYRPSRAMAGLAAGVRAHRPAVAALLVVVSGVAVVASADLGIEAFGDPPRNWLPDDPLRQEHERGLRGFYDVEEPDVKANVLVLEGPVTTPEAHRYMDALADALRAQEDVVPDTVRNLPFILRTYLTVRDGVPGAGETILREQLVRVLGPAQGPAYPSSQAEIERTIDGLFRSPLRPSASIFLDYPRTGTAILVFSVRADTYEDAAAVWGQVQAAIASVEGERPPGMQVAFVGNTATNYLFIAKELPWLGLMSVVTNVLVLALVWIPTRSWRATVVVGALNALASLWWLALLPTMGIGLAITLTLPLVFIYAIGSDYGLHLVLSAEHGRDPAEAFRTTGKSVLFSALVLAGAFLAFTGMSNLAARRTMLATAVAIGVMFVLTMLVVPLLYGPRRGVGAAAPAPQALPAARVRPLPKEGA